ncbi:MAG: penicillin-binding protein 2 [Gammaproteobacteria bacterium]|nr:penicillin-binding protein 2 [Gammaproteobacteria bacterium]
MRHNQNLFRVVSGRMQFVLAVVFGLFIALVARIAYLQTAMHEQLVSEGENRFERVLKFSAQRGNILDRNGQILSTSTPVDSLAANPQVFCKSRDRWEELANSVGVDMQLMNTRCDQYSESRFMYVLKRISPERAQKAIDLGVPGLEVRREYQRFFPGGPIGAQLIGLTDTRDTGQEGLELKYDDLLTGEEGGQRVLKDRIGRYVEAIDNPRSVRHGADIQISIDQRIQTLATRYLEEAVRTHKAAGGGIVLIKVPSGEIISMVNAPQFNPNDRTTVTHGVLRNRVVTDAIEPGSLTKPFTIAMLLEEGRVTPDTVVDTHPGQMYVGRNRISDVRNYGELAVTDIIAKSSNVGTVKLALEEPFAKLHRTLKRVGFGDPATDLPGESSGVLPVRKRPIEHATMSFGYGFSATALQIARAYTVFATDGILLPVTIKPKPAGYTASGERVYSSETALQIRQMLRKVATRQGTASRAQISGYGVGGKTGTTHKLVNGSYKNKDYLSLFAGFGPISNPQFVGVVVIDEPRSKQYFGGAVAAPVFSRLMEDVMRIYDVRPDKLETLVTDATPSRGGVG